MQVHEARTTSDIKGRRSESKERTETAKPMSVRIDAETKSLIDSAANAQGMTRTEFMLTSARERAIDVLLDQRLFVLNDADFEAFSKALDDPPPANAKLKALLKRRAPWEQQETPASKPTRKLG